MSNGVTAAWRGVAALACLHFAISIAAADTIYVSNEKDNTITVVDGKSLEPVKTIPVGQRPRGILLSKDDEVALHLRQRQRPYRGARPRQRQDRPYFAERS